MALEVGGVFARLGARLDDAGFDRFDRRLEKSRRLAQHPVTAKADTKVDTGGLDRYDRKLRDAEHSNNRFRGSVGKTFGGMRFAVAGATTVAAGAFGVFAKSVISDASDINESLSKNRVLFGDHAKEVEAFANESAKSYGISKSAVLEYTGTFGNLFVALGQSQKAASSNSLELTKLAADMASFNNTSVEDALEAIRSGLVGETEPLRRFGVNMNDATLKVEAQKLAKQGLIDKSKATAQVLDPETKAMAAQALIVKQTEKAHGDFARTSGGLANQSRILGAQFDDLKGRIGAGLLPAALAVTKAFNGLIGGEGGGGPLAKVGSVLKAVGEAGAHVFDWLIHNEDVQGIVRNIVGVLEELWKGAQEVGRGIADAFTGDGGVGGSLKIIGERVLQVAHVFTTVFGAVAKRVIPALVDEVKGLANIVRGVVDVIAGILTLDFGKAWDGVKRIFGGALTVLGGAMRQAAAPFRAAADLAFTPIRRIAGGVWDAIVGGAKKALDLILGYFTTLAGAWSSVLSGLSHVPGFGWAKDAARKIDDARDSIDKFRASLRKTDDDARPMTKAVAEAAGRATELRTRLGHLKKGTDDYRTTARELRRAQDDLNDAMRAGDGAGRKGARGIGKLDDAAGSASDSVRASASDIAANVNRLADSLGAKGIKFTPAKTAAGRRRQSAAFGPVGEVGFQEGGYLGGRGLRGDDSELVLAAPGEAFLTHHHQGPVEEGLALRAMFMGGPGSLDELFASDRRMHRFAQGGRYPGVTGDTDFLPSLGNALSRMAAATHTPIFVQDGRRTLAEQAQRVAKHGLYGPGNPTGAAAPSPNAPHVRGIAGDITPGRERFGSVAGRFGLSFPVPGEPWHVQIGGGGGGGPAAAAPELAGVTVNGPAGGLRRIAQAAVNRLRRAGQSYLDDRAGGGEAGPSSGTPTAAGGYSFDALRRLWVRAGGASGMASLMAHIALAESGGDPNARNPSGASGLWQILGQIIPGNVFNPLVNARNAVAKLASQGLGAWAASRASWGRYAARGGRLEGLARFARGGRRGKHKHKLTASPLEGARSYIKSMRPVFFDENRDYNADLGKVDDFNTHYSILERRFDLSDEELVDDDGNVDEGAVKARAGELEKLLHVRRQILATLRHAANVVRRTIKSYQATLRLMRAELAAAKGKDRSGLRGLIDDYEGRLGGWRGKLKDLTGDLIPNAKLDRDYLAKEKAGILGTKGIPAETDTGGDFGGDTGGDTGFDSGLLDDTGLLDQGTPEPVQLPPTAEQIAAGVAEAFQAFNAARADLFAQYGANFMRAGDFARAVAGGATPTELGAGARYFGGGAGGMDGGALETAGGLTVVQQISFAGPQPADPHTFTQAALHELKAAV